MLSFTACQQDELTEGAPIGGSNENTSFEIYIEDPTSSRVSYEGLSTRFTEGDKIGVYSENIENQSFTVNEAKRAISDIPIVLEKGTEFYAYYPYSENIVDITAVPVSIETSQIQQDANFSHVSKNDVLIAAPAKANKTIVATFQHVGAWIDFVVYNRKDEPLEVNSVTIKATAAKFVKSGTVNISAAKTADDYLKVTPAEYTDQLQVTTSGEWAVAQKGEKVVLRVAILPSDLSNESLKVEIKTSGETITQYFKGRDFQQGHVYQLAYNDKKIYLPKGNLWVPTGVDSPSNFNFSRANLHDENSNFCWKRSKQSDNIIVFWEPGFGDDPSKCTGKVGSVAMKTDVDDLLEKMEAYYALYRDELQFIIPGYSRADEYKLMVFLYYTDVWVAYGGGIDNMIGVFWIAPSACKPVGQTVAHELGHSFQALVAADLNVDTERKYHASGCGYSHNIGSGNVFWEMSSNYMAWQNLQYYKTWSCEIPVQQANAHKGFTHEWVRYQYFYMISLWEELHGRDILGKVWRFSTRGEDAIQTYQRITNTSQEKFNDEVWLSAAKEMTWSFTYDDINGWMREMIDNLSKTDRDKYYTNKTWLIHNTADDYYRCYPDIYKEDKGTTINYAQSPQSYGYNAIYLQVPTAGTEISIDFEGLSSYPASEGIQNYNYSSSLGWRWGIVACTGSGGWTPVYSDMQRSDKGTLKFTVPEGTKRLVFVVTGAPTTHTQKRWDSNTSNDYHFPYRFKVTGTGIYKTYAKIETEDIQL